jgi:hypothetical protein
MRTVALLGGDGGELLSLADVAVTVPATDPQTIQDVHGTVVHVLCEVVESRLADAGWFDRPSPAVPGPRLREARGSLRGAGTGTGRVAALAEPVR